MSDRPRLRAPATAAHATTGAPGRSRAGDLPGCWRPADPRATVSLGKLPARSV